MAKPKTSENMRIWEVLGKTDPAHTKTFKRAGGFSGTAIKPMWANKQMTELFGPCGIGWGQTEPQFQTITTEGEIMVYCTVGLWYTEDKSDGVRVSQTVYGVGGDKVLTQIFEKDRQGNKIKDEATGRFKTYPQTDDEAFKKAYTDALSNAMKFIGVAADVHMGMFDDNKYVRQMAEEFEEEKKKEVFAEVDKQKAAHTAGPILDVPPELDWSYNKGSGVLICKPMDVKKSNRKKGDGNVITVQLNGLIDNQKFAYYFHKSNADELMGCVGKVCKFMVIKSGDFVNIDEVLEIDGVKMEAPKEDLETTARLLASNIGMEEEELREFYSTVGQASWTVVVEALRQRKTEIDAGVEVGSR